MTLKEIEAQTLSRILKAKGVIYEEFMVGFGEGSFSSWKVEELCNWVNDEFMLQGLTENDAPNEYGIKLEKLLDVLNRQRLTT